MVEDNDLGGLREGRARHPAKEVPTFAEYADEFQKTHVLANNKPSEREAKACILKHHLLPAFGSLPLAAIRTHAIETLKASLLARELSRKRVNNVLACLGKMLRYANEIEILEVVPRIKRDRKIPLTKRLRTAFKAARHLRSELVFCYPDGKPLTRSAIEAALRYACKLAGLRRIGSHVLRHTFCSHLAMKGAAPKAIQDLAGHSTVTMTLRYMHLAPSALREAIGLLDDFGQQMGNAPSASA